MKVQDEKTSVVVNKLFQEMKDTVTAYGPGAVQVGLRVEGTSFFPAGIGLWRGSEPHGIAPADFPRSPILILGHNWGTVAELERTFRRGIDNMNLPAWRCLPCYLEGSRVDKMDCFFTNVLVGLQPTLANGRMLATEEFYKECRTFLCKQIRIVKPRLVAILGQDAAKQYRKSGCLTPFVELDHPSSACAGYNAKERVAIIAEQARKLRNALEALNRK